MTDVLDYYPKSYEDSRDRFTKMLTQIELRWPHAKHSQYHLLGHEDLTIDWIQSGAIENNEKVLLFTTAEHGIEGYVGMAMLTHFVENYLPKLNPSNTGLLLVHGINPWGMQQRRRTNPNNVDLNRNFVIDPNLMDPSFNPKFSEMESFFSSPDPLTSRTANSINFYFHLLKYRLRYSWNQLRGIWLLGQYRQPKGIHYGSTQIEQETGVLMELYKQAFRDYEQVLHLDMHTGYGPRYQMSLVNSVYEKRNSAEFSKKFNYPLVVAANPDEFYAISGDMIDYVYLLHEQQFPSKHLYATSFEFGTFGESTTAQIRTLKTMIFENQFYWYGASDHAVKQRVLVDFQELFFPQEEKWRRKAVADADQAFQGILNAEGYLKN